MPLFLLVVAAAFGAGWASYDHSGLTSGWIIDLADDEAEEADIEQ